MVFVLNRRLPLRFPFHNSLNVALTDARGLNPKVTRSISVCSPPAMSPRKSLLKLETYACSSDRCSNTDLRPAIRSIPSQRRFQFGRGIYDVDNILLQKGSASNPVSNDSVSASD